MTPVVVSQGLGPIILGQPHGGTFVPDDVLQSLNENGRKLADTDWHIDKLYDGLLPDVTTVAATFHRYVIDANRDPAGQSLYPGQNTTGLCPVTDFDGLAILHAGQEPSPVAIQDRIATYHAPYHRALAREIARAKSSHGFAIVFDCHSIRSRIPFLFDGDLPQLNVGTDNGKTCAFAVERAVYDRCAASEFTHVLNGRFRGGWTTRHYGQPQDGVHAIQMEIAQSLYLTHEAPPWTFDDAKAAKLRSILKTLLQDLACLKGLQP